MTRTDKAKLLVTLEGQISLDAARAVVTKTFENVRKTDLNKVN